jgi:hypothetical protein
MGKLLLFMYITILIFLSVATVLFPQSSIFLFASNSSIYQYVRELMLLALILQLFLRSPRHAAWIDIISGSIALSVTVWAMIAVRMSQILPIDSLTFLGASIAIGFTILQNRIITPGVFLTGNKKLT